MSCQIQVSWGVISCQLVNVSAVLKGCSACEASISVTTACLPTRRHKSISAALWEPEISHSWKCLDLFL